MVEKKVNRLCIILVEVGFISLQSETAKEKEGELERREEEC